MTPARAGASPSAGTWELTRVGAAIGALAVLMTHPLLLRAWRALPGDLGDPLLNTFILGWDASRMPAGFRGVWAAPFFFPLIETLALSEHLIGVAVFVAPIVWLTRNPLLAYNLAFLGSYILAGVGMYLLARSLWGRRDAAYLAALAFAFAPHRVMYVPYLQVLMSGWMPLSLWGLHGYFENGSRRSLGVFAAAFALLALSNGYFLYFFTLPVAIVALGHLARGWAAGADAARRKAVWRDVQALGAAALAVAAAIAPAAMAYARLRREFGLRRDIAEIAGYGARWSDYLRIPDGLWLWMGTLRVGDGERMLFPGLAIVLLAAMALPALRRSWWPEAAPRPAAWTWNVGLYAAVLAMAFWLSAGPSVPGPYTLLVLFLPGFDGLRVPARFVVVVALALGVLGSAGAAWLLGRLRPRAAAAAAAVMGLAVIVEGYGGPMRMVPFRHDQPSRAGLNAWLRAGPAGGVLELPITGPALKPFTLVYQYNTLRHGHPVVNGYSGYGYGLQDFLGGPGSPLREPEAMPGLLDALKGIGVRYVVVHPTLFLDRAEFGWPDPKPLVDALARAAGETHPGRPFEDAVAWRLDGPPALAPIDELSLARVPLTEGMMTASAMADRLRFALDGRIDTKWMSAAPQSGKEWIRVDFGRETDAGRLVILTGRFGVGDHPRRLEVESEAGDGARLSLYSGSFLPMLVRGLAGGAAGAPAVLDLPSNRSRALWIRQTGQSRTWQWAVHELQVYERRPVR